MLDLDISIGHLWQHFEQNQFPRGCWRLHLALATAAIATHHRPGNAEAVWAVLLGWAGLGWAGLGWDDCGLECDYDF